MDYYPSPGIIIHVAEHSTDHITSSMADGLDRMQSYLHSSHSPPFKAVMGFFNANFIYHLYNPFQTHHEGLYRTYLQNYEAPPPLYIVYNLFALNIQRDIIYVDIQNTAILCVAEWCEFTGIIAALHVNSSVNFLVFILLGILQYILAYDDKL